MPPIDLPVKIAQLYICSNINCLAPGLEYPRYHFPICHNHKNLYKELGFEVHISNS